MSDNDTPLLPWSDVHPDQSSSLRSERLSERASSTPASLRSQPIGFFDPESEIREDNPEDLISLKDPLDFYSEETFPFRDVVQEHPKAYVERSGFSREVVESVWELAAQVPGTDPALWRQDEFGIWIHRLSYGQRNSQFGWEIFDPAQGRHSQGVYAMRPLQWSQYVAREDTAS